MFIIWPIVALIMCTIGLFIPQKYYKIGSLIVIIVVFGSLIWGLYLGYWALTAPAGQNSLCGSEPQIGGYCKSII